MKVEKKKSQKKSCERLSETNNFKMKKIFSLLFFISAASQVNALIISEIMYDPEGTNAPHRWVEIYNDTGSSINITSAWKFVEYNTKHSIASYQGGSNLPAGSYAIIAEDAQTFATEYSFTGILFDSAFSHPVTNTGDHLAIKETSSGAEISPVDYNPSVGGNNDGSTLSTIDGIWVRSKATPGADNQAWPLDTSQASSSATSSNTQQTVQAQSAPSPDIVLYMPFEKTVVAGADSTFATFGMTRAGNNIDGLTFNWSYGDGGQGEGTSTLYRYVYPGRYMARVEAGNGHVMGNGFTKVRVVSPDIAITKVDTGKYGLYVDIYNPNVYDLDLSQWKLSFDGKAFCFPKNTIILGGETTRFSGLAMGFASTTVNQNSVVRILFPNLEEVTSYTVPNSINSNLVDNLNTSRGVVAGVSTSTVSILQNKILEQVSNGTSTKILNKIITKQVSTSQNVSTPPAGGYSKTSSSTAVLLTNQSSKIKDTRLITWFKSLFGL